VIRTVCFICKKPLKDKILCTKCYQKLYPSPQTNGAWYEPKGIWAKWRFWEQEKSRNDPYQFLKALKFIQHDNEYFSLYWDDVAEIIIKSDEQQRKNERWIQKNWRRKEDIDMSLPRKLVPEQVGLFNGYK
jgi:hypothetical protein